MNKKDIEAAMKAHREVMRRSAGIEEEMRALEGGELDAPEFAKRLAVEAATLDELARELKILQLPSQEGDRFVYPAWQIHQSALLPGLQKVLTILAEKRTDPLSLAWFFLLPRDTINQERPLDLLRRGEVEAAVMAAVREGEMGQ